MRSVYATENPRTGGPRRRRLSRAGVPAGLRGSGGISRKRIPDNCDGGCRGLASTVGDLAAFFRAVFSGGIFEDPSTVDTMLSTLEVERAGPDYFGSKLSVGEYRMGVTVTEMGGYTVYRHGGFYGTMAAYVPELDLAIGATVNRTESGDELYSMVESAIEAVASHQP